MQLIEKYFPDITDLQHQQYEALFDLYVDWNSKINVISRKDIDQLYVRHVLHSLVIAKWIQFVPGTKILDVGCGGGFPGIPLAIMFPQCHFHLVDSIRKKLKVVDAIAEELELKNVKTSHQRVEAVKDKYDFVVTRAVAKLPILVNWVKKNISDRHKNALPNGLIALKGGQLKDEIKPISRREYIEQIPINQFYEESFFEEKFIVYVQG